MMRFGAVDWSAKVWLNGKLVEPTEADSPVRGKSRSVLSQYRAGFGIRETPER